MNFSIKFFKTPWTNCIFLFCFYFLRTWLFIIGNTNSRNMATNLHLNKTIIFGVLTLFYIWTKIQYWSSIEYWIQCTLTSICEAQDLSIIQKTKTVLDKWEEKKNTLRTAKKKSTNKNLTKMKAFIDASVSVPMLITYRISNLIHIFIIYCSYRKSFVNSVNLNIDTKQNEARNILIKENQIKQIKLSRLIQVLLLD